MAGGAADPGRQLHDELMASKPEHVEHDASGCPYCVSPPSEMAGEDMSAAAGAPAPAAIDPNDPTIIAIVNDRVQRETASAVERATEAEKARDEAQAKLDVLEAEKAAAIQRAETAEQALEAKETAEKAAAEAKERIDGRVAEMREVAGHLPDTYFADENRRERWGRMGEEEFAGHKAELAAAFEAAGVKGAPSTDGPPRETAMEGGRAPVAPSGDDKPKASTAFIAGTATVGRRNIPAQV